MPRRYYFPNLHNARDLGGYESVYGGETLYGRFIRCDGTGSLTPEEVQTLVDLGVTTAIDLRGADEVREYGDPLAATPRIRYVNAPLAADIAAMGIAADEAQTGAIYQAMAENAPMMRLILAELAEAEGASLFHCSAGKDRTGIVAAVLLLICGVREDDVVADYMVSEWYIREVMEAVHRTHPEMPAHFVRSRPAYMEDFLDRLRWKYGDVQGYLAAMGVHAETIACLRMKLLGK